MPWPSSFPSLPNNWSSLSPQGSFQVEAACWNSFSGVQHRAPVYWKWTGEGKKGKTPQIYFFPPILFLAHHSSWVYEVFITKFHDFRKWNSIVGCHKRKKLTPYTWCLGRLTLHRTIYLRHFWKHIPPKRREMIKVHQMGPRMQALACSTADLTRNKP